MSVFDVATVILSCDCVCDCVSLRRPTILTENSDVVKAVIARLGEVGRREKQNEIVKCAHQCDMLC